MQEEALTSSSSRSQSPPSFVKHLPVSLLDALNKYCSTLGAHSIRTGQKNVPNNFQHFPRESIFFCLFSFGSSKRSLLQKRIPVAWISLAYLESSNWVPNGMTYMHVCIFCHMSRSWLYLENVIVLADSAQWTIHSQTFRNTCLRQGVKISMSVIFICKDKENHWLANARINWSSHMISYLQDNKNTSHITEKSMITPQTIVGLFADLNHDFLTIFHASKI